MLPANWNNSIGVERWVTCEVMGLDMPDIHGHCKTWSLVQVLDVPTKVWVLMNEILVRFEVHHIHLLGMKTAADPGSTSAMAVGVLALHAMSSRCVVA